MFCAQIQCRRGISFEVEGVAVVVSGFSNETLLVTGTEGTTRGMREMEGKEVREGNSSGRGNCAR